MILTFLYLAAKILNIETNSPPMATNPPNEESQPTCCPRPFRHTSNKTIKSKLKLSDQSFKTITFGLQINPTNNTPNKQPLITNFLKNKQQTKQQKQTPEMSQNKPNPTSCQQTTNNKQTIPREGKTNKPHHTNTNA